MSVRAWLLLRSALYSAGRAHGIHRADLSLGPPAAGAGARPFRPAAARHVLAVDHRLPRPARRCGLYRDGGRARPRPAPPGVRRLGAAQAHHPARSDRPGKPGRRKFRGARGSLSRRGPLREGARVLRPGDLDLEPITPIRSTGAASPRFTSASSRRRSGISRSSQRATRSTISTGPPACWRMRTRTPASPNGRMRCSARSPRFRRCPKPISITPRSWRRRAAPPRRANGRRRFWRRSRRCPGISSGASGPGSARRTRC